MPPGEENTPLAFISNLPTPFLTFGIRPYLYPALRCDPSVGKEALSPTATFLFGGAQTSGGSFVGSASPGASVPANFQALGPHAGKVGCRGGRDGRERQGEGPTPHMLSPPH